MFSLKVQQKGLKLSFECSSDVPRFVQTDEVKLRQVLINLLNNAVNFTKEGGVTVRVTSEVGSGTILKFDIKAAIAKDADIEHSYPIRRAVAMEPGQPRFRLLIVDDKSDNRAFLVNLLTPFGFDLQEAANGKEAFDIWSVWKPHLIWMDLRMPVMDGHEAINLLRKAENEKNISHTIVIAVTASAFKDARKIALSKPFLSRYKVTDDHP
ncbi:MAG: response regulator [Desulfobacula sp.]|nr:response regulator [Desulfobacula sp.]